MDSQRTPGPGSGAAWPSVPPPDQAASGWIDVPEPEVGGRRPGASVAWDVALMVNVAIAGLFMVGGLVIYALMRFGVLPDEGAGGLAGLDEVMMWLTALILVALFGVGPVLWAAGTRYGGWAGVRRYLHLERPVPDLFLGLGLGVFTAGLALGALLFLDQVGWLPEHLQDDGMVFRPSWAAIVAVSLAAGVAEELFFRGILQKWLQWWGQAIPFALFHVPNGGIIPAVVTLLIGLLYGYLVHRGRSLYLVMAAHFMHNFILFSLTRLYADFMAT